MSPYSLNGMDVIAARGLHYFVGNRAGVTARPFPYQGFCVGRSTISLTKDCGAWVTIISTTCATSDPRSIFDWSRPACGLNSLIVDPGHTTETRIFSPRNSSATE